MFITDAEQIRACDAIMMQRFGTPGILLMENAGSRLSQFLSERYPQYEFLVLCGPGNNGGDGLVAARLLHAAGKKVRVILSHPPGVLKGDAKTNFERLSQLSISVSVWGDDQKLIEQTLPANCVLVDALLGTGIHSNPEGSIAEIIHHFRQTPHPVVAADLPSGLFAGSGRAGFIPIKADYTLTFHLPKICHYVTPAAGYCGEIIVADIGIQNEASKIAGCDTQLLTAGWFREHYHPREKASHKGTFGHVLVIGGSRNMAGSVALSGAAALRAGAGLVTAFVPGSVRAAFYRESLEQMCFAWGDEDTAYFSEDAADACIAQIRGKSVVAIGPGMGTNAETARFLERILPEIECPVILDADALNLLAEHPAWWKYIHGKCILTPHPGEMRRLCGVEDVNALRYETAQAFSREKNCILVLKGAGTIVAVPDGKNFINATGNPGMATAGSGDVLTGMIAALVSCGYTLQVAAAMGVFLHGLAGDLSAKERGAEEAVTAEGILSQIGFAFHEANSRPAEYPVHLI